MITPAMDQCMNFFDLALEASVYLRPEPDGLTREELDAAATAYCIKQGTLNDAAVESKRLGRITTVGHRPRRSEAPRPTGCLAATDGARGRW